VTSVTIPKRVGRDCELSTTGLTSDGRTIQPWRVTREVLAHIDAALTPIGGRVWRRPVEPVWRGEWSGSEDESSDTLRHWTSSGQCFYSDMSHVEAVGAETVDPLRLTAQSLGVLTVCEAARRAAEEEAPAGTTYALTTANVDIVDPSIAWGSHFNVAVTPELWQALFRSPRDWSKVGYVSSVVAGLVPFFGCGYVLPLRRGARFSLSARAHHLNRLSTLATTEAFRRGLLNERREGHSTTEERLHLIGFDFALAGSSLLTSMLQCALAAAEIGEIEALLRHPVRALKSWSYGVEPDSGRLCGVAGMVDGRGLDLPAFVRRVATHLLRLIDRGVILETVAPRAADLLPRVIELTRYLDEGAVARCAPHLDWAAKLLVLSDMADREGLTLDDPRIRVADHDYASSDPRRGHFWRLWGEGRVDPLITARDVEATLLDGPEDGRGWGRGRLVRLLGDRITRMDWSYVELDGRHDDAVAPLRIEMPHTGSHSKAAFGPVLREAIDSRRLRQLAVTPPAAPAPGASQDRGHL
jgi:hypothetical protein